MYAIVSTALSLTTQLLISVQLVRPFVCQRNAIAGIKKIATASVWKLLIRLVTFQLLAYSSINSSQSEHVSIEGKKLIYLSNGFWVFDGKRAIPKYIQYALWIMIAMHCPLQIIYGSIKLFANHTHRFFFVKSDRYMMENINEKQRNRINGIWFYVLVWFFFTNPNELFPTLQKQKLCKKGERKRGFLEAFEYLKLSFFVTTIVDIYCFMEVYRFFYMIKIDCDADEFGKCLTKKIAVQFFSWLNKKFVFLSKVWMFFIILTFLLRFLDCIDFEILGLEETISISPLSFFLSLPPSIFYHLLYLLERKKVAESGKQKKERQEKMDRKR